MSHTHAIVFAFYLHTRWIRRPAAITQCRNRVQSIIIIDKYTIDILRNMSMKYINIYYVVASVGNL